MESMRVVRLCYYLSYLRIYDNIVYVDDLIFWSKDVPLINGVAMQLRELGVDLEQVDDAAGFLGVTLDHDGPSGLLVLKS